MNIKFEFIDVEHLNGVELPSILERRMNECAIGGKSELARKAGVTLSIVKGALGGKVPNGQHLLKILFALNLIPTGNLLKINKKLIDSLYITPHKQGFSMDAATIKAILMAENRLTQYDKVNPANIRVSRSLVLMALSQLYLIQSDAQVSDYIIDMAISAIENELNKEKTLSYS